MKNIHFFQPMLGADVEFFLEKNGSIIGAEKVLDEKGLDVTNGKFIIDGVQCEINPKPSTCRALFGYNIQNSFKDFKEFIKKNNCNLNFNKTIEVEEKHFDSLSDKSKEFGCEPDYSVYNNCKTNIKISGKSTRKRTAGGHIHIGCRIIQHEHNGTRKEITQLIGKDKINIHDLTFPFNPEEYAKDTVRKKKYIIDVINEGRNKNFDDPGYIKKYATMNCCHSSPCNDHIYQAKQVAKANRIIKELGKIFSYQVNNGDIKAIQSPEILIPLMDLLVGIPSVLVDRDPLAAERRKIYGKAGDFRYQPHGIEYRTLTNFWLISYPVMSLFLGLSRMAYLIAVHDIENNDSIGKSFLNLVDQKDIIKAINESNYQLARDIFSKIEPLIVDLGNQNTEQYPINQTTINQFKQFVLDGYFKYFDKSPLANWGERSYGWESWCRESIFTNKKIQSKFAETVKE